MQSRVTGKRVAWALTMLAMAPPGWAQGAASAASAAASAAAALAASAVQAAAPVAASSSELGVVVLVACAALLVWITTRVLRALAGDATWSLADALSEEVTFSQTQPPVEGAAPVTTTSTRMVSSSSRTVMLFGLILIGSLYGGFGAVALFDYASTGKVPDLGGAQSFLLCGLSLFAPYAANQIKSAVASLGSPGSK